MDLIVSGIECGVCLQRKYAIFIAQNPYFCDKNYLTPEAVAGDLWLAGGRERGIQRQEVESVGPMSGAAVKSDAPCFWRRVNILS